MNKHVIALGVLGVALIFMADRCVKLEKKLAIKSAECECYKFTSNVYKILCNADDDTDEKKEA